MAHVPRQIKPPLVLREEGRKAGWPDEAKDSVSSSPVSPSLSGEGKVGWGHLHPGLGRQEMGGADSTRWGTTRAPSEAICSEAPSPPTHTPASHSGNGFRESHQGATSAEPQDCVKPNLKGTKFVS